MRESWWFSLVDRFIGLKGVNPPFNALRTIFIWIFPLQIETQRSQLLVLHACHEPLL